MSTFIKELSGIISMPPGISGINYDLINMINLSYITVSDFLDNHKQLIKEVDIFMSEQKNNTSEDQQILESPENNNEYTRLIPPYIFPCIYSNKGCIKKAAFKITSTEHYYCWFHVNCQNTDL